MPTLTQHPGRPAAFMVPKAAATQWLPQLFRSSSSASGQTVNDSEWLVKIEQAGKSHTFPLRAKTKEAATEEARGIHETILAEGWTAALSKNSCPPQPANELKPDDINFWKDRLMGRRYHFPATGGTDNDWAVKIDHAGSGYWFPLGTSNPDTAAKKARQIHQTVTAHGWDAAFTRFSRELIVSCEWSSNPILWTYTTIHTLVKPNDEIETSSAPPASGSCRIIILETEAGIRRALEWCVNRQTGLCAVPCAMPELLPQMLSLHRPALVLLNRSLAERVGVAFVNGPAALKPGLLALGYSVSVDGDQMFVSTPGGAEGYMLKRVKPVALLDPILNVIRLPNQGGEIFAGAVKSYFKELLRPQLNDGSNALARLTPRENDVLTLLSKGCVDKEIAQALDISIWTVHGHIKKIFERLQVRTRTEAVVRYLEK